MIRAVQPALKEITATADALSMERRRELRVRSEQDLRLTILAADRQKIKARAVDLSGRGMRVLLPSPVSPGDAVKIELDDALVLGEVCYCQQAGSGFVAGIEIDQALNGLTQLAMLHDALLGEARPRRAIEPELVAARR